jgi:L,D-peptidoglycan transpeptidase YkuD (ErfK/YbiS/YcfS/YnhG family)
VVVTPGWTATGGSLHRFERGAGPWRPVGRTVDVVVGRTGLGWGRGLHPEIGAAPQKREGDGRAPAGVFALTEAFGYAPLDSAQTGLPYLMATAELECVDDVESAFYNRVIDRRRVEPDWESHEEMRRRDVLYRRGVVVAHNPAPTRAGDGSCIFIHVWRGPGSTTSGCTAMPEPELEAVIRWLDAAEAPVLVQLPIAEYRRLARSWELPALSDP